MSDNSSIEWTEATWSPVTGCTKVSDGCTHCYIDRTPPFRMAGRKFNGKETGATTGVMLHPERLGVPLRWRKARRIFVCSLADLFQDEVPDEFIARVFAAMAATPRHTYQVLTKRHARMRSLLTSERFQTAVIDELDMLAADWPPYAEPDWPLPNVWVGVSVEDQKWADIRIPALRDIPAAVRFLSAEPLLGPLADLDLTGIGWVICGGESGPGARPMHPGWARSLRDQCSSASVPYFFKQWGEWMPLTPGVSPGREIRAYPGALVQRVGKKAAGRELDGRTWDEYPVAAAVSS